MKMSSKKLTNFFSKTTSSSPPQKQQEQKQEQENNEIVLAEKYHPPENFVFPKSVVGKQQRSCQYHWFKKFTWLHYDIETDAVLCFLCLRAEKKEYLTGELSKEQAYISKGFKSWKKARNVLQSMNEVKHIRLPRRTRFRYQDVPMLVTCYLTT